MNLWIVHMGFRGWRWVALVLVGLGWGLTASAATFSTTLDRDSMAVGETASLSLIFQDGAPQGTPSLPDIPGLNITYEGPSTQTSFTYVNGEAHSSSTTTYQYAVTAQRPGTYTIPALAIQLNGAQLSSQPLTLTVTRPNAPSAAEINNGSQVAFAKLVLAKNEM